MEIKFEEEYSQQVRRSPVPKTGTLTAWLVARGIVKTDTQAGAVLVAVSIVFFLLSLFIITRSLGVTIIESEETFDTRNLDFYYYES